MSGEITLPVTNIQRFCMHDGPGIRTTVFLKGCPLHCKWCHNPEARDFRNMIMYDEKRCIGCTSCIACPTGAHSFDMGVHRFDREKCIGCGICTKLCPSAALETDHRDMTISEIVDNVMKDSAFYSDGGGVTLSGGEAMIHGEKTLALIKALKDKGLNVALETSGCFDEKLLCEAVKSVDLFLWDYKDSDEKRHFDNTGASLKTVVENLRYADSLGAKTLLRCIILEGVNFTEEHLESIRTLKDSLANCIGAQLIAYHPMGDSKCRMCGVDASFHDRKYIPDPEKLKEAGAFLLSFY